MVESKATDRLKILSNLILEMKLNPSLVKSINILWKHEYVDDTYIGSFPTLTIVYK